MGATLSSGQAALYKQPDITTISGTVNEPWVVVGDVTKPYPQCYVQNTGSAESAEESGINVIRPAYFVGNILNIYKLEIGPQTTITIYNTPACASDDTSIKLVITNASKCNKYVIDNQTDLGGMFIMDIKAIQVDKLPDSVAVSTGCESVPVPVPVPITTTSQKLEHFFDGYDEDDDENENENENDLGICTVISNRNHFNLLIIFILFFIGLYFYFRYYHV
jgi:hypothetical protein